MKEDKKMQLSSLIAKPLIGLRPVPSSSPPPSSRNLSNREERLALFEAAEKADADFENAKQVADSMLQARSLVIEQILLSCGKGPFSYKGQKVRIIKRRSDDGKRVIFFFRAVSRNEPEEID